MPHELISRDSAEPTDATAAVIVATTSAAVASGRCLAKKNRRNSRLGYQSVVQSQHGLVIFGSAGRPYPTASRRWPNAPS